jgi:hypothetical protein
MDANRLTKVIRQAEAVSSEAAEYRGLPLGTLFECWPDEVLSGRVGTKSRGKSAEACVVRAYVKLAKAGKELAEAVQQLDSPQVPIEFMREVVSPVAQQQFVSPKRSPKRSSTALARLPPASTLGHARPLSLQFHPSADAAAMPVTSAQLCLAPPGQSVPVIEPMEMSMEKSQGMHNSPVRGSMPHTAASPQQQQQQLRQQQRFQYAVQAADLLGLPASRLLPLLERDSETSRFSWRRLCMGFAMLLLTLVAPRIVFRLWSLLVQTFVRAVYGAVQRVGNAAASEASSGADKFVHFLEEVLDVCLMEPDTSPAVEHTPAQFQQHVAAAALAATDAIMSNGSSVTPSQVAQIVAEAVAVAMPVKVMHPPAETTPMGQSWKMPGWLIFLAGSIATGVQNRAAATQR